MDIQLIRNTVFGIKTLFFHAMVTVLAAFIFASCAPIKQTFYFDTLTKDTTISSPVNKTLRSKIVKGDDLAITVSSLSREEDLLFNTSIGLTSTATTGYIVDPEGNVSIHKIGKTKAEGFTRQEFAAELEKQLLPFLKDPIVNVQFLNHKITILGAVDKPQVLNMPEEQLSLLDVLVLSGDVSDNASRNNIMVIRESGTEKQVKHINLEDQSIFTSPWYYLQPNDIVVVKPDFVKEKQEKRTAKFQVYFSIAVSTISLLIIILDRVN